MSAGETTQEVLEVSLLAELVDRLGPVAVMDAVRDDDGRIVDFRYRLVNEAFLRTLNEPADVLVGAGLLELYPSHLELGLFDAYCRVVETGEPFVSELPWFDERNLRAFLEVMVTRFHDGYLMTGRDITEAKMARQVTRIFDSSQDGIISVDIDGLIMAWNAGAKELYGYTDDEAIGQHLSVCVPDHADAAQSELLSVAFTGAVPRPSPTECAHRDGTVRRVEIAAAPMIDGSGGVVGASLVHRRTEERSLPQNAGDSAAPTAVEIGEGVGQPASRVEVEIWSEFSRRWLSGFAVIGTNADGTVRVRRPDGVALPEAFAPDLVRSATDRSRSSWPR